MNDRLPEVLRKLRVTANYSQEYLAEQIGVSLSTYSRYERGGVEIDFTIAQKLAALYRMTLDEFSNYGDPSFKTSEPQVAYVKRLIVPITVSLDGSEDNLKTWINTLTTINTSISLNPLSLADSTLK